MKSAAGEALSETLLDDLGVQGDRRWMVVDAETGRFLTQRLLPSMTQLNVRWLGQVYIVLSAPGMHDLRVAVPGEMALLRDVTIWRDNPQVPDAGDEAAQWLSQFLGRPCRLVHVTAQRARQIDPNYAHAGERVAFADGFPLLLIGQASLDDLAARVGRPLSMERFRPNLVVSGSAAYAEDGWARIRIGEVEFRVVKGCSRCIMTTLDPLTGERSEDREPLTTLRRYRERDGEVFFGQNLIACSTGRLVLNMPVEVLA